MLISIFVFLFQRAHSACLCSFSFSLHLSQLKEIEVALIVSDYDSGSWVLIASQI